MRLLAAFALSCILIFPRVLIAQEIPVDFFEDVTLDAPIPVPIRTGEHLVVAGTVDDAKYDALTFYFSSYSPGVSKPLMFTTNVTDGRFAFSLVFDHGFSGTYDFELFGLSASRSELGLYESLVIERGSRPMERSIKGFELEEPIPAEMAIGEIYRFKGRVTDPKIRFVEIVALNLDGVERVDLPFTVFDSTRVIDLPLQFSPGKEGDYALKVRVVADDPFYYQDFFWALSVRGPQADVVSMVLSLIPENIGRVPVINRGVLPLELTLEHIDDPFEVVAFPDAVPPGQMIPIEVIFHGPSAAQGEIVVRTNDPAMPEFAVLLSGTSPDYPPIELHRLVADKNGLLRGDLDFGESDFVLALYPTYTSIYGASSYDFTIGDPPLAKDNPSMAPSVQPDPHLAGRAAIEATHHEREQRLVRRLAGSDAPYAAKPTGVDYQTGDERILAIPQADGSCTDTPVHVVAVNDRVVAFVPVDFDFAFHDLDADKIAAQIDLFAGDLDFLNATFGAPSDVDGDGKVAFLYVENLLGGDPGAFFTSASLFSKEMTDCGNETDLLFLNASGSVENSAFARSVMAHEYQHLINFNHSYLINRVIRQQNWLNEGLSHMAEDLVGPLVAGGTYMLAAVYLSNPARISLGGNVNRDLAKRGAAYLFLRGLVDRFGLEVLRRLVQQDQEDIENVERATGVPFAELLTLFAAELYLSDSGLLPHPWFNYQTSPWHTADGRGFPQPTQWTHRLGEEGIRGTIAWRGLGYVHLKGDVRSTVEIQTDYWGGFQAVVIPVPKNWNAVPELSRDALRGIRLDYPLPTEFTTGEEIVVSGTVDDPAVTEIRLHFTMPAADLLSFVLRVDGGRFERSLLFEHSWAGNYQFDAIALRMDEPYLGGSVSVTVLQGTGEIGIPASYFNDIRLDRALPRRFQTGQFLPLSGSVRGDNIAEIVLIFQPVADGESVRFVLPVGKARFSDAIQLDELAPGVYYLEMWKSSENGASTYLGRISDVEITPRVTAVLDDSALPAEFSLSPNYPNPFNAATAIRFGLPRPVEIELSVFNLAGQKISVLAQGHRDVGIYELRWDGRDETGRQLASGVYIYRLVAGDWKEQSKLLLVR